MKNLIWIASYPKSGNTMLRLFLAAYFFTEDGIIKNFDILKHIISLNKESAISKLPDYTQVIKKLIDNPSLVAGYWKMIQEDICSANNKNIYFIKTHNANITYKGNEFTNYEFTKCFVYIVRDPRSVLVSMMSHYNFKSYEDSRKYLMSDNVITTANNGLLPEIMLSWKSNYLSWKNFLKNSNDLGIIIKYEDMVQKPEKTFLDIIKFICEKNNLKLDNNKFFNSLNSINFDKLKKLENIKKFPESAQDKQKFFRKGIVDEWKNILPKTILEEIEGEYSDILNELNY